jgi:tetratricopeptide (TPR) repeat protein
MGNAEVEAVTQDIFWVHRDDQPSIEFNAPKSLYAEGVFERNYEGLQRFKADPSAIAPDYSTELETPEFYCALAELWNKREEPEKALETYEKLVRLQPASAEAWSGLANAALARNQPLRAEAALKQAVSLAPNDAESARLLGRLRWRFGLLEEAQRAYELAAAVRPPDESLAAELGNFYSARKSFAVAGEYYRSSLSQGRGTQGATLLSFAKALNELKAYPEAEQVLQYAGSQFATNAAFPLLYGEILLAQERWQEALPWFQRALAVSPGNADAYYGMGRVALGLGGREEAYRQLIRAMRSNPYHVKAARLLQDAKSRATIAGLEPS